MLLTHYGYYAQHPRPWGTYYDDNFMQDPRFYDRHLGDSKHPTPCFARGKDLVIPPWKEPRFWRKALADPALRGPAAIRRRRAGLVLTLTLTLTLTLLLLLLLTLALTLTRPSCSRCSSGRSRCRSGAMGPRSSSARARRERRRCTRRWRPRC